ncbi:MAG TPA: hypothetical protein VL283_05100 [Candidatus Baltobacteraceae bacterium]|nr:hypothetical protein [Candidatus Baltobacteraceae bacterium]
MTFSGPNPTVLVPGFAGGTAFFIPFREATRARGNDAVCWERAPIVYRRRIAWHGKRLAEDFLRLRRKSDVPLTAVGWSEGGLIVASAMRHLAGEYENPHDIVRRAITFGSPFDGTWAASVGGLLDRVLHLSVREMRPGSPVLTSLVAFLHRPRRWDFQAVSGTYDLLVHAPQESLDPAWCHHGPWDHTALFWHPGLFDLIHTLIERP